MFYTYAHYKPQGGIFYIGKGSAGRAYFMHKRSQYWQNVVNKYGKPHVEILANWDTEQEAHNHEKLLISSFKDMGYKLVNLTDGGEGTSGYKHTDQQRLNNSLSKKGKPTGRKGIPLSAETKAKMSMVRKGKAKSPLSEETRAKISIAKKGKPATRIGYKVSDKTKAKMSLAHIGKTSTRKGWKHTDEAKAKMKATKMKNKELKGLSCQAS